MQYHAERKGNSRDRMDDLEDFERDEVMKDASLKTGGPLRADLRSFREGKIFVSASLPAGRR